MLKWQTGLVGNGKRVGGLGEGTYAAKTEAPLLPPVPRRSPARDGGKKSLVLISVDPLSPPPTPISTNLRLDAATTFLYHDHREYNIDGRGVGGACLSFARWLAGAGA